MQATKIIAISVGVAGFGVLLLALSKARDLKNAKDYIEQGSLEQGFDAKGVAVTLYDAMREANFTNTQKRKTILTTLTGVSARAFSLIVKAFGARYYNTLTGNTYFAFWQIPKKHPLKVWLKQELSLADYQLLQSKYPKQL